MRTLKSERSYVVDYCMTMNDVVRAYEHGKTITGMVISFDATAKTIRVNLGINIVGEMPWSETTIYDFTYKRCPEEQIPDQVIFLKYRIVRVKVVEIKDDGTIILSRKRNQLENWNTIMQNPADTVYNAEVTGVYASGAILDIGEGVTAFCHVKEISLARIEAVKWLKIGDRCDVVILMEQYSPEKKYNISCSRKKASKATYSEIKKEQILTVRVSQPVYQGNILTGFFVEVAPNVSGIADLLPNHFIPEIGDYVRAVVTKNNPEKMKLQLDIIDKANII